MLSITNNGKKNIVAIIFGKMRKEAELTPIISKASICSVTLIEPISEAILDPTFPANINASIVGENSNINESLLANPTIYFGINGFSRLIAVCILITAPTNKEIMVTIPSEFTPTFSISNNICFQKTEVFLGLLTTLYNRIKYFPKCVIAFNMTSKISNLFKFAFTMKKQKYYLFFILAFLLLSSCGVVKKKPCDCPQFSNIYIELNIC